MKFYFDMYVLNVKYFKCVSCFLFYLILILILFMFLFYFIYVKDLLASSIYFQT